MGEKTIRGWETNWGKMEQWERKWENKFERKTN